MTVYIAFLRGINVGGRRVVKMEPLRAIMESLRFQNVKTYIQSGNVLFEAEEHQPDLLRLSIESKLEQELGFSVPTIVRTRADLEQVVIENPFPVTTELEQATLYITFLERAPEEQALAKLNSYRNDADEFRVAGCEVYLRCVTGYGTTVFSNNFFESMLEVPATTRNWKTVNKMLSLAKA